MLFYRTLLRPRYFQEASPWTNPVTLLTRAELHSPISITICRLAPNFFGFDSPDSLKQTIESILRDIPRVWSCEEDHDTVIDIITTQKIMVSQAAEALSRHDKPMDEVAEHLRKTVEKMECDICETRKFVVLTNE